jgi:hypothetical protein
MNRSIVAAPKTPRQYPTKLDALRTPGPGQCAAKLLDTMAADLIAYRIADLLAHRAGHECRRCHGRITDHEYIQAGLFFSLCAPCLASSRQTMKDGAK